MIVEENLSLLPGDMRLAGEEQPLAHAWIQAATGDESATQRLTAPWRGIQRAASDMDAQVILLDLGSNLGSVTRAHILMANHIVVPVTLDMFALQGLRTLAPILQAWRTQWHGYQEHAQRYMNPLGYILSQHSVYGARPASSYNNWKHRFPAEFRKTMVAAQEAHSGNEPEHDPNFLGRIKNYRSLMPLAVEARKPIFDLRPADGAIGAHMAAVQECDTAYKELAQRILAAIGNQ